jgi:hypothetical protein
MNELNGMTCAELADVAAELALGVLTGRERAVAIAHLDTCDACREDVRQMMGAAERLRGLLPQAEPPAGFETRVLQRLGLPAPADQTDQDDRNDRNDRNGRNGRSRHDSRDGRSNQRERGEQRGEQGGEDAGPLRAPGSKDGPRHRRADGDTARPGAVRTGTGQAGAPPAGPGGPRRPGRMRRVLAAAAVCLAVVAAGLGGWRAGVASAPAASQLTSASLMSTTSQPAGKVFYYTGDPGWLYMSVDLGSGNGTVTCQVIGADGRVTTIGSFRLADGYGAWGSPDPGDLGKLTGARLVSASGTVLAAGTFTST